MQYSGITKEWREHQLVFQKGKCPICLRTIHLNAERNDNFRAQADHCHETNEVRGLLCRSCNVALGLFNDDVERLMMATVYIKLHREGKLRAFIKALSHHQKISKEELAITRAAKALGVEKESLAEFISANSAA